MAARGITLGVLLLALLFLVACGDTRSAARRALDTKFELMDYKMASLETQSVAYNNTHLLRATQQYVALVRKYADQLGRGEARRRLIDQGNEVGPYCLPCKATLESEATRY
jgi:hypothetical protein